MSEGPDRSRWYRFSLRTLLLVVTMVCVWLGYQLNWIRQRQEFVAAEKKLAQARTIPIQFDGSGGSAVAPGLLWMLREKGYPGAL